MTVNRKPPGLGENGRLRTTSRSRDRRPRSLSPYLTSSTISFANLMGGFNPPQAAQTPRGRQGVPPSRPSNFLRRPAVFFTALRALKLLQRCPEHGGPLQTEPVSIFVVRGLSLALIFWGKFCVELDPVIKFSAPGFPVWQNGFGRRYPFLLVLLYSEPTCLAFWPLRGPACLGVLSHVSTAPLQACGRLG